MKKLFMGLVVACSLVGCGEQPQGASDDTASSADQAKQNILSLGIDGWSFVRPSEGAHPLFGAHGAADGFLKCLYVASMPA